MPDPTSSSTTTLPAGMVSPEIRAELAKPNPDYYVFFGLPESLQIDLQELQRIFYERSRLLHPDRFARANAADRARSIEASSVLNDGYRTLRDPLRRAEYVLSRHGFNIGEQRSSNVPPELLEEVFELNMALEELRSGDEDARSQLEEARERFLAMQNEIDNTVESLFARWDEAKRAGTSDAENSAGEPASKSILSEIRSALNRRRYIQNLVRDVEAALAGVSAS